MCSAGEHVSRLRRERVRERERSDAAGVSAMLDQVSACDEPDDRGADVFFAETLATSVLESDRLVEQQNLDVARLYEVEERRLERHVHLPAGRIQVRVDRELL